MTTTIGDPLGHPAFVRGREEERYDSDSDDDDDDDVDRYVFLARQPVAPAEARDGDGAMLGGGGGSDCGRKRRPSEILAHAPPADKKARLALAAPRAASAEESGSEEATRSPERFRGDLDQGKKNKKRRRRGGEPQVESAARGKRSRVSDSEARPPGSQHRHVMVGQKTSAAAAAGAPGRRFLCSICGRGFGSYQALGGHVHRGHITKAKDAIAAASRGDVTGNGCRNEEVAMADGNEKAAVAASPLESDGYWKTTLLAAAACRQDADSSSGDSDSNSNEDQMFIDAANHRRHGNVEAEKVTAATSHDDDDKEGNGTEGKAAVRRCHELAAIGNGNSGVRKTQYRCGVCGQEYLSGKALGGHMKKHRKLSPHNGSKERRSPEVAGGAGQKTAVAASPAAACRGDVDSSSGDSNSNEEMFINEANHRGDGNVDGENVTSATSDDDDGTVGKAAVGRCHESAAIGNGNSAVREKEYRCGVCGQEYPSGKALGGHMRKHRKLSTHDGSKEGRSPEVADGAGHGQEKAPVAASHGEFGGHGKKKKSLDAVACHRDVDSSSGNSNEEMFIGAAKHDDADGNGNGTVGRCHELAATVIGNGNSIVSKTQYRCEVCSKEYLSGQALGGHMRMHRKNDGSKERRSPEVDGIPDQRAVVMAGNRQSTNNQYGTPFDGSLIGWV